ncbi:MAG: ABC transporter permease [Chromatiaceae bacterium]|nr:MAG: ABC transporter permease [Chromatiaceae bacterium]
MRRFLLTMRQELTVIFSDRAVVLVLIGGSLFYALFYPLPYQAQVATALPVAVVDHDSSALSRQLVRWIDATEQVQVTLTTSDVNQVRDAVRRKALAGYIEIPNGFGRQVLRGEPARIGVFANGAYLVLYSQVANATASASLALSQNIVEQRALTTSAHSPEGARALAMPVAVDLHELYNPDGGYANYVVPAVLILILQQTFLIGICMVQVGRREQGEIDRAPLVMIARVSVYLALQCLLFGFYMLVVYDLFSFPHLGSAGLALVAVLPGFVAVTLLGLLLGCLFSSRETALQVMMLVSVPALFLAGFAWPAEAMPGWLVNLGLIIPSTGSIDAFVRVYQMGAGLEEIRSTWLGLWCLALLYAIGAWWAGGRSQCRGPSS